MSRVRLSELRFETPREPEQPRHFWMSLTARGLVREDRVLKTDEVLIGRATPARDPDGNLIPRTRR